MAELKIMVMDAGQGDCILVVYPDNSLMLVDCGSTKSGPEVLPGVEEVIEDNIQGFSAGGPNVIDTLVLTHPDIDHYNQLTTVAADLNLRFGEAYYGSKIDWYNAATKTFLRNTNKVQKLHNNLTNGYAEGSTSTGALTRAGVSGWIIAANACNRRSQNGAVKNGDSIVILLEYQGFRIFLMGDATGRTEDFILQSRNKNRIQWSAGDHVALKVGHHGSNTSSTQPWIEHIMPEVLFISSETKPYGFKGLPLRSVISDIKTWTEAKSGQSPFLHTGNQHTYVEFDDAAPRPARKDVVKLFRQKSTTESIYTTNYGIQQQTPPAPIDVYGGTYYYTITDQGGVSINRHGS